MRLPSIRFVTDLSTISAHGRALKLMQQHEQGADVEKLSTISAHGRALKLEALALAWFLQMAFNNFGSR